MDSKATLAVPLLIIALGAGWLLTSIGVVPQIDWIWTLGLATVGIGTFILSGFDKFSAVAGSFPIIASCLSVFRQTGGLPVNVEAPVLVISLGMLMLVARSSSIPIPSWFVPEPEPGGTN